MPTASSNCGDVAQRDRVALLGAPVLARVAEIRQAGGDPPGATVLHAGNEEQQPAQPVVGAARFISAQGLHDEHFTTADAHQWPRLVLAAFELALLHRRKGDSERIGETPGERPRGGRRENKGCRHDVVLLRKSTTRAGPPSWRARMLCGIQDLLHGLAGAQHYC